MNPLLAMGGPPGRFEGLHGIDYAAIGFYLAAVGLDVGDPGLLPDHVRIGARPVQGFPCP